MVREEGKDADEQRVIDDVRQYGWHTIGIEDDPEGPGFAYSVGMFHTLGHPEIIIFGLPVDSMMSIVNYIGEEVRQGASFQDGQESDQILEGYRCVFRAVPEELYPEYFGYAMWFYRPASFPVLQCVWPDRDGRFPWHHDFDSQLYARQPVLAEKKGWPFSEPKNQAAITTVNVLDGTLPIALVTHDEDGGWQFLCGATNNPSDCKLVSLKHIVDLHPSVGELADLPEGWQAVRLPDGSWSRVDCGEVQTTDDDGNPLDADETLARKRSLFHDKIAAVVERLCSRGIATRESIRGCSPEEIAKVRAEFETPLPLAYEEFLVQMGRGAVRYYEGTDMFYPQILGTKAAARELVAEDPFDIELPEDAIPFSTHQGYQFLFIRSSEGDDPPVYYYLEQSGQFEVKADEFSKFLLEVADDEW